MKVKVTQSCPTLCNPMDYTVCRILQARILEWGAFPSSRGSSNPGIKPRSPALQADSLPADPPGKPKNTGVGSLSLLQGIFSTQEPGPPAQPHCLTLNHAPVCSPSLPPCFRKTQNMYPKLHSHRRGDQGLTAGTPRLPGEGGTRRWLRHLQARPLPPPRASAVPRAHLHYGWVEDHSPEGGRRQV